MKRLAIIVGCVLAIVVATLFYYLYLGGTAPGGQQPLVHLNNENVASLKDVFNGSANSVRVIVMLSPT